MHSCCCQRKSTFDSASAGLGNTKTLSSPLKASRQNQSKSISLLSLGMALGPQGSGISRCGTRVMHGQLWRERRFRCPCLPTGPQGNHHHVLHILSNAQGNEAFLRISLLLLAGLTALHSAALAFPEGNGQRPVSTFAHQAALLSLHADAIWGIVRLNIPFLPQPGN